MANLNFQQPPRNIANTSLTARSTGGFGGSSLSGHVTPTSAMFPSGGASYGPAQPPPPQLSPNRNVQLPVGGTGSGVGSSGPSNLSASSGVSGGSTRTNTFNQRPYVGRRIHSIDIVNPTCGTMTNMGTFMQTNRNSSYGATTGVSISGILNSANVAALSGSGSGAGVVGAGGNGGSGQLNSYHSVFGGSAGGSLMGGSVGSISSGADSNSTPALLDPSEFPSLTNARGQNEQTLPQTNPLQPPGSKPYVGMVKQPTTEQSEFTMSSEDFPALPGTQNLDGTTAATVTSAIGLTTDSSASNNIDSVEKTMNSIVASSSGSGTNISSSGSTATTATNNSNSSNSTTNNNIGSGNGNNSLIGGNSGVMGSTSVMAGSSAVGSGGGSSSGNNGPMNINILVSSSNSTNSNVGNNNTVGVMGAMGSMGVGLGEHQSSSMGNSLMMTGGSALMVPGSGNNNAVATNVNIMGTGSNEQQVQHQQQQQLQQQQHFHHQQHHHHHHHGHHHHAQQQLQQSQTSDNNNSNTNDKMLKSGVQTSPDGKVTNIPATMVNNQFGMVGLLTFIRAAESDPNLVTLALGTDLTGLGLNLNSQESLHPTFAGPFADYPCRSQDVDYNVPPEYLINFAIRDKLSSPLLKKLHEDLLFFLFYTNIGDIMQLMAAVELHSREWRYHIEEKIWITRIPGLNQYEKNGTKERGTFYYFDAQSWKRLSKVLQVDWEKLDKCPNLSTFINANGQPV